MTAGMVVRELLRALRAAHDTLLMRDLTGTRGYQEVKAALDKHDHVKTLDRADLADATEPWEDHGKAQG